MIERRRGAAGLAGLMLVVTIALSAGIGFAAGSLVGLAVPLGLAGVFVGLIAGFALVYTRFKHL